MIELSPIMLAFIGTMGTFIATALGSAVVFLFRGDVKLDVRRTFLGFAAGIMIAASFWSLLLPAIDMAEAQGKICWIPAAGGFLIGGVFLFLLDKLLPHLHVDSKEPEGLHSTLKRTTLLVLAVTLHNIPEGLAVGLAFGMSGEGNPSMTLASAVVLAVGIGLQNFPEGAAISLPLKQEGLSRTKAFLYGAASGIVEPIAGVSGVLLAGSIVGIMPWMLAAAAGAMIYVVVEELIPEAHLGEHSHSGTAGVMLGFLVMMILDIALS
ncbi:ZIP family metal transporter [Sinanaerobacter chloroacetimidivorans]|jgi:ZIP family zinc transporter|uniref:ZIP family metal transporter n=1 Tax=Sinanaerobacter chloroacetimidivorans TaxID=2818044 RepID=A0A8J7VZ71_9FIRM|nr:ZIP family metal transporter [Sinanaerobacter chloroacetimidivorans]MBR0596328.1 ZIP family metal transporter [Sinanaerobacter chloroacetimidivorans]